MYHFAGRQWCHSSNGIYAAMIDYGHAAILPDPDHPEITELTDPKATAISLDLFTPYDDVWLFLKNTRDFLQYHVREELVAAAAATPILDRVERLLDMEIIRTLQDYQLGNMLGAMPFSLKYFPKIRKNAKTPKQYLLEGYFDHMRFDVDQSETEVFRHYNHPGGPQSS